MYKNIIPDLVSFDTNLNKIRGFSFAENLNFFSMVENKNKFHYKIVIENDIVIPDKYEFRSGYYIKKEGSWYYERKILGFSLKFKYDIKNKIFYINKNYSYLSFEIGSIYPAGRHIADLINLDLFLNEFNVYRGCAFSYNNEVFCIISPGFNGKTSFMCEMIELGAKYIAEDALIINTNEKKVYPSACFSSNFGRSINKKLFNNLNDSIISKSIEYDQLFLLENCTEKNYEITEGSGKKIDDFLLLCSLFFINNNFSRAIISEENYIKEFFSKINFLNNNLNYKYIKITNFNFKKILMYGKSK